MAYNRVDPDEVRAFLQELAAEIERGELKTATIKWCTTDGEEHEHTFQLETEEDRTDALLAIRTVLGQVH